jgi:hypothetical protein
MPSFSRPAWADALHTTAHHWTDPDHESRQTAIETAAEDEDYPFTEAHITFGVNQQMDAAVQASLHDIAQQPAGPQDARIELAARIPLYGLPLIAYLTLRGTRVHLADAPANRPLLHAMLTAAQQALSVEAEHAPVQWSASAPQSATTVAMGTPDADALAGADYACADYPAWVVLDGNESADEREALAEDILVYDGESPQHIDLIWAPEGLRPDPYLEALAHMRAAVPAHERIPGTLQMQRALLEAQDAPHAYAEDLTFLFSKGAPEPQRGLHVRWTPYHALSEMSEAFDGTDTPAGSVRCRVAITERVQNHPPDNVRVEPLGTLHRATWWPPAVRTLASALDR